MKFRTKVTQADDMDATGIVVPAEIVEKLAAGKRPQVTVTLAKYSYRSTIFVMGGQYVLPLALEHREKAGVKGGDDVEVELALDTQPREVIVPADLAAALNKNTKAKVAFDKLSYTYRKEHVRALEDAKKPETRQRRLDKILAGLAR